MRRFPLTANYLIDLLEKAGLPKGVLNVVHGGRDCVDALLIHPKVRAISFVGSSPVAKHIYETGTRHGKRVQANGGAKNYIVVMPDADVAAHRRSAVHGGLWLRRRTLHGRLDRTDGRRRRRRDLLPSLVGAARAIKVGPTDVSTQPDMGPVITAQHRDRVLNLVASGEKEGAKIICDGRHPRVARRA